MLIVAVMGLYHPANRHSYLEKQLRLLAIPIPQTLHTLAHGVRLVNTRLSLAA